MPNMDGPTATREIRASGYTAPILGVTGNGLSTDIEYFMANGVDNVLLKPLKSNVFVPCALVFLWSRRIRNANYVYWSWKFSHRPG